MKEGTGSSRSSVGRAAIGVGRRKITEGVQEAEESRSRGGADERGGEDSLGSFFFSSIEFSVEYECNLGFGTFVFHRLLSLKRKKRINKMKSIGEARLCNFRRGK